MREIKFRVWDTFNYRMIYDPYYFRKRTDPEMDDDRFNAPMQYAESWQDVEDGIWRPCYLMQFTGLLDKNGKEIFEGDVIKHDRLIGEIKYFRYGFFIEFKQNDKARVTLGSPHPNELSDMANNCEVIGNIFENKILHEAETR
jgi:uncharacterized phage protein (TIGR01671 family)